MENIGILEKIREKRKEEARIRQLSTLKKGNRPVTVNLPERRNAESEEINEQMAKLANMSRKTYEAARVIYNEGTEEQKERANKGRRKIALNQK